MIKQLWRYVRIDSVSTIFLVVMTGLTVYSMVKLGVTRDNGLLAMCDAFIFRGILWQGWSFDLKVKLQAQIEELQGNKK
jgi:hypothetical protein